MTLYTTTPKYLSKLKEWGSLTINNTDINHRTTRTMTSLKHFHDKQMENYIQNQKKDAEKRLGNLKRIHDKEELAKRNLGEKLQEKMEFIRKLNEKESINANNGAQRR